MKRIFVPTRDGTDWQRLLAKPTMHWKMGASAMTAWCDGDPKYLAMELPRMQIAATAVHGVG